jgi:NADPH-dependent 2,4-dienoyl-CoA reductase/sulfur reductase-like enzyme
MKLRPVYAVLNVLAKQPNVNIYRCTANLLMGQHIGEKFSGKTVRKKKNLVADGSPAGMKAAITAASRGHDVALVEKAEKPGGG